MIHIFSTKNDYQECLKKILYPIRSHYTDGRAGVKCGQTGVQYGEETALIEAFARPLWGLAPFWAGGGKIDHFDEIYLQGIINGTNSQHTEYWGNIRDYDQKLVEVAPLGLALILCPDKIWTPLTGEQKENLFKWLWQVNEVKCDGNNWSFFPVLVNLGLKNIGVEYDKHVLKNAISEIDSFYQGNGWYTDGNSRQIDYYIAFAFHFYGLIYARVMEQEDVSHSRIFKERAMLFAKDFIYWFAEDGSALAFGRSLTYRFAQCCFWSACVFAGIEPFPMGVMKGIISRHLDFWMNKPIFDNGGILSIGYAYPNLNMSEEYNAFGSPYWALKAFLILALDEKHKFFSTEALPLPKLESIHVIKEANIVIQRINGYVVALPIGQWAEWFPVHTAERYSKFAYSSKYAFSVPRSYQTIESAGSDSMLVFIKDEMCFVRKKCVDYSVQSDGNIYSKWMPFKGVVIETYIVPQKDGHIRKHFIDSDDEYLVYDCAFATEKDEGDIWGTGETVNIKCVPNTSLMFNDTYMKAVKYNINKGRNCIETVVKYPCE